MCARTSRVLLALTLSGCGPGQFVPAEVVAPNDGVERSPADLSGPPPNPTVEPLPPPEPPPGVTSVGWQAIAEPQFVELGLREGTEHSARYALESGRSRYALDLRVGDDATTLVLTELGTGHSLAHEWPTSLCSHEFYAGDGATAAQAELAHDERGRKLLELWVTCRLGEDIVRDESLMLLILEDAHGLAVQWSGTTSGRTSHVCGEWSDIETTVEGQELVITRHDRGEIFSAEDLPGYDCEDAREYDQVRGRERLALP